MDKEKTDVLSKRCGALVDAVVEILDKWENQVGEEIKLTNHINELSEELDTAKKNVFVANRTIKEKDRVIERHEKTIAEKDKLIDRFVQESNRQQEELGNAISNRPDTRIPMQNNDAVARLEQQVQSLKKLVSQSEERNDFKRSLLPMVTCAIIGGLIVAAIIWLVKH